MTLDSNGNLFGTSQNGGGGDGTIWEIAKGASTITTLATFIGTNGAFPHGGVTLDANGNLFGTSYSNGAIGNGSVWELAKGSGTITTLAYERHQWSQPLWRRDRRWERKLLWYHLRRRVQQCRYGVGTCQGIRHDHCTRLSSTARMEPTLMRA